MIEPIAAERVAAMREMLGWCLEQRLIVLAEVGRSPIAGATCLPPCFNPRERRSGALRAVKANPYDLRPRMLGHPFQHLHRLRREADTAVYAGDQK